MLEQRLASARGVADLGWLNSRHTFSFGHYHDPQQQGFSDLLVINEDRVQPGQGFSTHPHQDMEIFSWVLAGALAHKDSMGSGSVIRPGDGQIMSAGSGITHSEFNPSDTEPVHFLQIWIVPDRRGVAPRYQQTHFPLAARRGCLHLIMSSTGKERSLSVYQDISVYTGLFDGDEHASLSLDPGRYAFVHLARGAATINGLRFLAGDGARVCDEEHISIADGEQAEVLVFDLRPNVLPMR